MQGRSFGRTHLNHVHTTSVVAHIDSSVIASLDRLINNHATDVRDTVADDIVVSDVYHIVGLGRVDFDIRSILGNAVINLKVGLICSVSGNNYIEYGIAQIGALQVWANFKKDPQKAIDDLFKAESLGSSRPLPELFATANIKFDFTPKTLEPLMQVVWDELGKL